MKKLLGILVLGLGLLFNVSANAEEEKEVVWEVYAKPTVGDMMLSFKVTESYTLKKSENAKKNFRKIVKKLLKECKKKGKVDQGKCIVTVIKYYEPNDPSKNRKLVNTSGIDIKDVRVSWNGMESGSIIETSEKKAKVKAEKKAKEEAKAKAKAEKKAKSKVKKETTESEDISARLQELKSLYNEGILTREELEKAIDILLYKNY